MFDAYWVSQGGATYAGQVEEAKDPIFLHEQSDGMVYLFKLGLADEERKVAIYILSGKCSEEEYLKNKPSTTPENILELKNQPKNKE